MCLLPRKRQGNWFDIPLEAHRSIINASKQKVIMISYLFHCFSDT